MSSFFRLTNAEVLIDGEFRKEPFSFENGIISNNFKTEVDLEGFWILPGIIDLHGDGFERHLNPRPSASFQMQLGLNSAERELSVNGITTAYFAQAYSWEGGYKSTSYAKAFLKSLKDYRKNCLTDIRAQLRYEILMPEAIDELINLIKLSGIDYLAYNNHIPVAQQLWKDFPERIEGWAAKSNRTGSQLMQVVDQLAENAPSLKKKLTALAEQLSNLGIKSASHDDRNKDERSYYNGLGATICEFPTSLATAQHASSNGNPIIMGAPNVVRGGSQSGSISAVSLIEADLCDALVSDYYYPALCGSMWSLHDNEILKFEKAWGLLSSGPAKALSLKSKGKLELGYDADFIIMDPERRVIEATFCKGKPTYLGGKLAGLILEKMVT
ncbi:MAG: alpha-D-ribose 1-methylphosphonate 5-triphosphate diphosphatase [Paracoccaceae bacterium]|nr:alpha-D-ribose 1-methylphosphonate 5-triphosphate diphosphatase [Paracoccaceae bacterium]